MITEDIFNKAITRACEIGVGPKNLTIELNGAIEASMSVNKITREEALALFKDKSRYEIIQDGPDETAVFFVRMKGTK